MLFVSVKSSKLKKYLIIAAVVLVATIGGIISVSKGAAAPAANVGGISMTADSRENRIAFFSQFGYEISDDPVEVKEVIIPTEFDETYEKYNALQKKQGLDLEKYKGRRVKAWSYEIKNYPDYENSDGIIRGNILVYDGKVIGGDICSVESDGFMTTFDGTQTL